MQLGSLQYPHNPMKGASEHFHFLSVLAGTYDDTVRNIDIDRAGYLRHSFIAGFPTERVPKMPLSGVSTRSGDLARFAFKALDGTMTDVFIHLRADQLVTLSGTGVSVLVRIHSSIGRGSAALKLTDSRLDSTLARIIFAGECPWEFFFLP